LLITAWFNYEPPPLPISAICVVIGDGRVVNKGWWLFVSRMPVKPPRYRKEVHPSSVCKFFGWKKVMRPPIRAFGYANEAEVQCSLYIIPHDFRIFDPDMFSSVFFVDGLFFQFAN
jgi:hypothetical protein